MNLVGCGIDIAYIPRFGRLITKYPFSNAIQSGRFWNKFLHPKELERCHQLNQNADFAKLQTYIAGCWTLKEAAFKALNNCIDPDELPTAQFIYNKLIYRAYTTHGVPLLKFDPTSCSDQFTAKFIDHHKLLCSISHDKDYITAMVNITKQSN